MEKPITKWPRESAITLRPDGREEKMSLEAMAREAPEAFTDMFTGSLAWKEESGFRRPGWRRLRIKPTEGLYWPGDSEPAGFGEIGLETVRWYAKRRGPISFDAAVKLVEAPLSAFRTAPEAARELRAWLVARFFMLAMPGADFGGASFYRPVALDLLPLGGALDEAFVGPCIEKAASSRPHYDALREAAAVLLRARRLAGALADWAADVLHPEAKAPAGNPGRQGWTNTLRDKVTVACIARLEAEGMTATRNEVSPSHSACDAVREALGRALSYKTIEGIWNHSRAG